MRSVPLELKQKLLKRFYGSSADNLPHLQVIAKQASINTLITEVIHEGVPANFGDVAIRQLPGEAQPSLVYAICIDNGIGNIYSRKMPAFAEQEWEYIWSLGAVKDVAIEFDGEWRINPKKRYYELMTEDVPYIFFTDSSDNLYVQKWSDETTRILIAENASQISVCRGWQSTLDTGVDQGLIIGYLRDGKVFYRSYCQQSTGEYLWETENEVVELGIGNNTLCVFRTNDFRVGFLTENVGEMNNVLSERTYAGQAMPPEYAEIRIQDARVWLNSIRYNRSYFSEHTTTSPVLPYLACHNTDEPALSVVSHERLSRREIVITFNRPVGGIPGAFENYFTTFPDLPVESCVWQNGNELKLTLSQDLGESVPFTITVSECREAWQVVNGHRMPIEAMEFQLPGFPHKTMLRETASVEMSSTLFIVLKTDHWGFFNESATVNTECTIALSPVGILPI
ncbi:MAG: hypothetical protein PHY15_00280 [Eubacteriales bacterium]|nr:hypothetical protein [Eubacteriales bacterium]